MGDAARMSRTNDLVAAVRAAFEGVDDAEEAEERARRVVREVAEATGTSWSNTLDAVVTNADLDVDGHRSVATGIARDAGRATANEGWIEEARSRVEVIGTGGAGGGETDHP